ncbi:hypothetical protein EW146_g3588 [Bondarzewia mesenterica]|uniref:FAD-binding PCMH-type domain-containing protein n=1 Tax=Bondarzewia mesenterica TaxID=1095465 RepID=A0A4S4LXC1_9AGAM|nr:hypothetical protein EW146_g3588 [Bondarzewia mesenterica]
MMGPLSILDLMQWLKTRCLGTYLHRGIMPLEHILSLHFLIIVALISLVHAYSNSSSSIGTCHAIAAAISPASGVYYPGSTNYTDDIEHFLESSSQNSTCSVEPGSVDDVAIILRLLGMNQTPFAVKGGGHSSNVGFSSTTGVQIAMTRFSEIVYDENSLTADIGAGVRWEDAYRVLNAINRTVCGARATGVGVAGQTLGGGVNWWSNQYGETIDTVTAYELVLPNGTVTTVTEANEDLFFALKGGYNNFGIVTKFTFRTFEIGKIWAGELLIPGESQDALNTAVANFFANTTDPKATIVTQYRYLNSNLSFEITVFYDGPSPPAGIFDEILAIPNVQGSPATLDFVEMLTFGTPAASGTRFTFDDTEVQSFSKPFLDSIANETAFVGKTAETLSASLVMFMIWQNLPNYLSHGPESAWPADRSSFHAPINGWALWDDASSDKAILAALQAGSDRLAKIAISEGQNLTGASMYPNISPADTPLKYMYGSHVQRLREIKYRYDPGNVMGLTGGFKF